MSSMMSEEYLHSHNSSKKNAFSGHKEHVQRSYQEHKSKTHSMGCTIPVSVANNVHSIGNRFLSPNSPDVIKMSKGLPIVGLV
jgi:hypothetical protein